MTDADFLGLIRTALAHVAPTRVDDHAGIGRTTQITDLDIDSLAVMEMVGQVEDRLEITLDDRALSSVETVGELLDLLRRTVGAADPAAPSEEKT